MPRRASLVDTCAERAVSVAKSFINQTLDIYRPEYIALGRAEWDGEVLLGHFTTKEYPFTRPGHIGYVTAAMAALYLSQLAYVFTRLKIEEHRLITNVAIKPEHFFSARDRGDLVITRLNLKCRAKIKVLDAELPILLWQERVHRSRHHILCKFGFDFDHGAFSGDTVMGMPIPR